MWVLKFEQVTKRHRRTGPDSIRGGVGQFVRQVRRASRRTPASARPALDAVSFEIEQGSAVALVGANGAGKSTALRLMSRISYPTEGRVRVRGRVGALLEVGSGVHPELSGRENIWLYGSIIGIPRAQIRRRFDEIVDFSELHGSIEKQTKFYSSGMQLRLGFAIATCLEPQSLLVDESLATADLNFQLKCVDRLAQLVRGGTTLVFVSHEAVAVEALCARALLLDRGRLVFDGPTKTTLGEYIRRLESDREPGDTTDGPIGACRIVHSACLDEMGQPATRVATGGCVIVELTVEHDTPGLAGLVEFAISDGRSGDLIACSSADGGVHIPGEPGRYVVRCRLDSLPLRQRSYRVWVTARGSEQAPHEAAWSEGAAFRVEGSERDQIARPGAFRGGPVAVEQTWSVRQA